MDFTLKKYHELLLALKDSGYHFQAFSGYLENPEKRVIILRHDVDAKKLNSLQFAKIQAKNNIRGTYYFRIVPQSFDEKVIREIASLGHEIGYHYETMDTARGNINKAWDDFRLNLETFRKIVPITTICMHGSPLSKYDNRSLWKKNDYRSLGLTGEPYFDIDFSKVLYLTDTGRRWDGEKVSIRDKVQGDEVRNLNSDIRNLKLTQHHRIPEPGSRNLKIHNTNDIIKAAKSGNLPDQLMITFHPQRWTDHPCPWVKELLWQNAKNVIKRMMISS